MKYSEIKDLSTDEIREKLSVERDAITKMRINHAISPLENPKAMGATRKNIARMLTELRKREIAEANTK
ncbi:MAG: 50S ribosomal protein L29 [Flavobacteriales bacterium]|nr:50S ribosomal protein L29 [Flavobacteriales bacterium]NNK80990.1 50S ribosomal protein L29 [Flavobacteriales bacterium]